MADVIGLIDAFDRLVASSVDAAPTEAVEQAARVVRRARHRRGYLGNTVVVALAGGTGSGKSSLVNALAGEEVAPVGAFRPTTSEPLAWIPSNPEPGIVRMLDDVGIDNRIGQDVHDWLAVIDLPDTDSVELDHREIVRTILPEVDAVIWVLDPEKYQDRLLHAQHLRPLAAHAEQFLFALNQIDRLSEDEVPALVEDLRRTLRDDGIVDVPIVPIAADPDLGGPVGLEDLLLALRGLGDAKTVVHRKIVTDIEEAAQTLADQAGVAGGSGTGFSSEWDGVLDEASDRITEDVLGPEVRGRVVRRGRSRGRAAAGVLRRRIPEGTVALAGSGSRRSGALGAIRVLDQYLVGLAGRVGGDVGSEIRSIATTVDDVVAGSSDAVTFGESVSLPEPPGWAQGVAWLRRLALAALIVAVVWLVDTVRSGAELLIPVAVVVVAGLLLAVPGVAAASQGGRAAATAFDDQRGALAAASNRELDRRIGRPLREVLRRRAGLTAALTEFELARRELG